MVHSPMKPIEKEKEEALSKYANEQQQQQQTSERNDKQVRFRIDVV